MRIGRRLLKTLKWVVVVCLSILGGGLGYTYWCMTDGERVAQIIREHAVAYFPGSILDPGRVRISLYGGEVVFRQLKMIQKIENTPFEVLRIPWLSIRINTKKLAKGRVEAREVVVSQPTLRLRRRRDGKWNIDGLLADPWPGPWIETPPITIQNATLELFPDVDPTTAGELASSSPMSLTGSGRMIGVSATELDPGLSASSAGQLTSPAGMVNRSPAILRDVSLKVEGAGGGPEHLKFEGTARGDAFEKLRLTGTVDLVKGSVTLEGELSGLNLSENLRRRVPREARPAGEGTGAQ